MKLLRNWQHPQQLTPTVVTIGNFDGVHCGHRVMLKRLVEQSHAEGLASVVMIFEPQPLEFFLKDKAPARIMSWREKVEVLRDCGLDYVFLARFDQDFRSLTARAFIERLLVKQLNCRHLVIGDDFRFGCDRSGDFALLQQAGKEFGFQVEQTPTVSLAEDRVSSTRIRQAIQSGDFALAEHLLGRPFMISGHVRHGDKIGRTLDFPTANLSLNRQVSPLAGIYAVKVHGLGEQPLFGAANVGTRPAVNGRENRIEVHILDFKGDIYGRRIGVEFCHKLRAETNFPSLDALKAAIANDVLATRAYFQRVEHD